MIKSLQSFSWLHLAATAWQGTLDMGNGSCPTCRGPQQMLELVMRFALVLMKCDERFSPPCSDVGRWMKANPQ